jgi:hypothetical protein
MIKRAVGYVAVLAAALLLCSTTVSGDVGSVTEGLWPDSWPKELEPYRARATTLDFGTGTDLTVYEIPFRDREDFESAWPHILSLKSKGAPLILVRSPSAYGPSTLEVGVRILSPPDRCEYTSDADGSKVKPGPPWPASARLPSGELPEYVIMSGGKWVPPPKGVGYVRARQDIMLVCDGDIVDLNRIRLPADTPIIDRRFEAKSKPADAK